MSKPQKIIALFLTIMVLVVGSALATVSQQPMLTRNSTVLPNLMLMFDDSASMPAQFLYQYGGTEGVYGRPGPGSTTSVATCSGSLNITTTCTYNQPGSTSTSYEEMSPDVNRLYYDPRVRYDPRVTSTGTFSTAGTPSTTAFRVYFYKDASGTGSMVWPGTGNSPTVLTSYLTSYTNTSSLLATGATTGLAYPVSVATGTGPFPKFANRTECNGGAAGGSCSLAEERQNFANWAKYHSNRLDLAKTGLGYAFKDIGASLRLGWGVINTQDNGTMDSGVGLFDQTRKDAFYTWLYARTGTVGGTPSRTALKGVGDYFSRADNKGPWADTPDPTSTGSSTLSTSAAGDTAAIRAAHASCRRSFAMLVTDGYYNDSTFSSVSEVDYTALGSSITGTNSAGQTLTFSYNGRVNPYAQNQAKTLADVAMKYWITDLRTDLANRVKVIPDTVINGVTTAKGNESFWQNMGFYAVGLGLSGTLAQTNATLASLTSGGTAWPTITFSSSGDETTIDDMWHATINARGRLLSAKNANDLSDAVGSMLADIIKTNSSQSGVAISTANLTVGTRKYTPRYQTGSWTGNVIARNLDPNTGAEVSTAWQVVGTSGTTTYSGIPAYGSRNIVTWTGSSATAFTNTASVTSLMTAPITANLINYLRGDQSNEDGVGLDLYRPRDVLLGDIVNSAPAFVKSSLDMKYDSLPSGATGRDTYRSFYTTKAARTEGAIFVGANDGMLHAFRESTGVEVFAYIPGAVLPNIHLLASKNYTHRYFVDGPNVEADIYSSSASAWKNMVYGTTGAGAKAVYAVDVTNPLNPTVTWEISSSSTGMGDLGSVLTDVQTGRTPSGDWVAIFGNGYDSASGKASLFVVNAMTGALIRQIDVDTTGSNGLGGVRLVRDSNQQIVGAYAGDLKGKMWKFDLTGATSASWSKGLNGAALYDAGTTKPITAAPAVIPYSATSNVIAFATGKMFEDADLTTTGTQSIYGVLDSTPFGSPTVAVTAPTLSNLIQQTVSLTSTRTQTVTASDLTQSQQTVSYFTVSRNTVTFSTTVKGWYIDLPNTGQRTVYPLDLLTNRYVAVDTVAPTNVIVADPCTQSAQGQGWLYLIDGWTGGGPAEAVIDTNGDGLINTSDSTASGITTQADGRNINAKVDSKSDATQTTYATISGGRGDSMLVTLKCTLLGNCAPGTHSIKTREWRQLFMR
jgi:type IV pilus assembly protein PilY1